MPARLIEIMSAADADGPGVERAFRAMLEMKKLDVGKLEEAYART